MSIPIGNYNFEGPFISTGLLEDRAGVYAILDKRINGKYYVLDIGESAEVRTRVENHDRSSCWALSQQGDIVYAAYYTPHIPQSGRIKIEQELRTQYNPPCGER